MHESTLSLWIEYISHSEFISELTLNAISNKYSDKKKKARSNLTFEMQNVLRKFVFKREMEIEHFKA